MLVILAVPNVATRLIMAMSVGAWRWLHFVLMICVLYSIYAEAFLDSGEWCYRSNDTNSSCKTCDLLSDEILDCHNKSLQNVTVIGSDQMVGLNVSYNQLSTTPLIHNCTNLVWIDLSYTNLRVINDEAFRNIKSESLKILNMSNCVLLRVLPVPLEYFFPNLEIFILANNLLTTLNLSMYQQLDNFRLLDVRSNTIAEQSVMPCDLIEHNAVILVSMSDCMSECVQTFFQFNCDLNYFLPSTSENAKCHCLHMPSLIPMGEGTTEYATRHTMLGNITELPTTWLLSTTDNIKESTATPSPVVGEETVDYTNLSTDLITFTSEADYISFIAISSIGTADMITTRKSISTVEEDLSIMWKLIIGGSSVVFMALCLFLVCGVKKCLRVKSMQGQYTPWLPGNSQADYALYYSQNITSLLNVFPEDTNDGQRSDRNSQTSAYKVYSQLHFESFEAQDETVFYSNTETLA